MAYHYHINDPLGRGPLLNEQGNAVTLTPWTAESNVMNRDCEWLSDPCRCCNPCCDECCGVLLSDKCAIPVSLLMSVAWVFSTICCCCCLSCNDIPVYRSLKEDGKCPEGSIPNCCCSNSTEEWKKKLSQSGNTYVYFSGDKSYGCSEEVYKTKKHKDITVVFLENFSRNIILENLTKELASSRLIVFKNVEIRNWNQTISRESNQARSDKSFEQSDQYRLGQQIEAKIRAVGAANAAKEKEGLFKEIYRDRCVIS